MPTHSQLSLLSKPPPPPQETIVPSRPTSPEPMQLDIPDPSENVEEPITLTTETLSQPVTLSVPISVTLPLAESQQQEIPSVTQNHKFPLQQSVLRSPQIRSETPEVSLPLRTGTQQDQSTQSDRAQHP
jgi:hypothetical protein